VSQKTVTVLFFNNYAKHWQILLIFGMQHHNITKKIGQNHSHLCQVSSWCSLPKIIKMGQCFTDLFKK